MEAAAKRFFASPHFAVVGASQDRSKFGYRILAWYHALSLPVTPINPSKPTITITQPTPSRSYNTVAGISGLSNPAATALSFLTPPGVTRKVLEEAKSAGVPSVWLQPGSFDEEGMRFARENFENAVGGFDRGTVGAEGWCVLVDGEAALGEARRGREREVRGGDGQGDGQAQGRGGRGSGGVKL